MDNLYQGMTLDAVTGLYDERFRGYSPSLSRWVEQDPAQCINGANTYQFFNSSPVGNVDAEGEMWNGEFTGAARVVYWVPWLGQVWWAGYKIGGLFADWEQLVTGAQQAKKSQLRYGENAANLYSREIPTGAYRPAMHNTINEADKAAMAGGGVPGRFSGSPIAVPAETVEKTSRGWFRR